MYLNTQAIFLNRSHLDIILKKKIREKHTFTGHAMRTGGTEKCWEEEQRGGRDGQSDEMV